MSDIRCCDYNINQFIAFGDRELHRLKYRGAKVR